MRLVEAEVDIDRAAEIVRISVEEIEKLINEGVIRCEAGSRSPLKFSEVCTLLAVTSFRRANHSSNTATADDAAAISRLSMMAFASHLAEARYGTQGPLVRTTHPSHVPERYVIMSESNVCRVGTLEHYERIRSEAADEQHASIFVFDTKAAAEYMINAMRMCPFRWVKS